MPPWLENSSPRTRAQFFENQSTVLQEPEHGSSRTGARFSKNQSRVLREPEHGSKRTRAQFFENQSTVLREPEHDSPRTRAHLSWRTGVHLSGEPENISMFSTCSELTPLAPIPDGRMERIMHPCQIIYLINQSAYNYML